MMGGDKSVLTAKWKHVGLIEARRVQGVGPCLRGKDSWPDEACHKHQSRAFTGLVGYI